jgi:hypothetical protein
MTPEEYFHFTTVRSRFGALVNMPRKIVWRFTRPYFNSLMLRNIHLERELTALKKDLLATNHRINWLESRLDGLSETPEAGERTGPAKRSGR